MHSSLRSPTVTAGAKNVKGKWDSPMSKIRFPFFPPSPPPYKSSSHHFKKLLSSLNNPQKVLWLGAEKIGHITLGRKI